MHFVIICNIFILLRRPFCANSPFFDCIFLFICDIILDYKQETLCSVKQPVGSAVSGASVSYSAHKKEGFP